MKKPTKEDFGYLFGVGWTDPNGKRKYGNALVSWETRPRKAGGRPRNNQRPIHDSWNKVLQLFDSTNSQRSQGAFCRWAGIKPATFSNWKNKPLTDDVERFILEWEATFVKEVQGE